MVKKVYIIFKTHLDMGFTDYSENIVKRYLEEYIPNAIKTAYAQKDTDYKYIWTTGSWLVWEALKYDRDGVVEKAINDGLLKWHGLPYTGHTEYMNRELFEYGLSLSKKLDERFGKKTLAAKMSDVPGHTVAMVPLLADAGIELLHIGVNPATPVPDVPKIFRWKRGEKSIVVMYNGGGYGDYFELDDIAVGFGVTGDNLGPQGGEELEKVYREAEEKYPGAEIVAATLDDVAEAIRGMEFPVIENEIGDSWIHGVGTDPTKTRAFRSVLRQNKDWSLDFSDNLLVVPEHTWGLDLKTFFHDEEHYFIDDLKNADDIDKMERSWEEQREFVYKAAEIAGIDISEDMKVDVPDVSEMREYNGTPTADVIYQLFDRRDCERYIRDYLIDKREWAVWDFTKAGLPEYEGGTFKAEVKKAWTDGEKKVFYLEFKEDIKKFAGLPDVYVTEENEKVEISWFGMKKNRMPNAFWLKLNGFEEKWELEKLGDWINPEDALGHKHLHSCMKVRNYGFEIEMLDAPLVAPFGRHMYEWKIPAQEQDLYFNLYNNIWNTNFPMWFSDDAKFRFVIKERNL